MSVSDHPGTLVIQAFDKKETRPGQNQHFLLLGTPAAQPIQRVGIAPGTIFPQQPPSEMLDTFSLTVYHLNDLHGSVVRFSPEGALPVITRIASEINRARGEVLRQPGQGLLALAAGDDCAGSIFDELVYSDDHDFPKHPCYHLYSKIGLDAVCLGNHDFDQGLDRLLTAVREQADFPVLAANLNIGSEGRDLISPGAIVVINQVRVGLIGVLTRAENRLKADQGQIVDPLPVVKNMLEVIKPYCDLVVVLSHLGYCLEDEQVPMADAGDIQLANSLPTGSVDLLIGGHSHTILNREAFHSRNLVNGIPIVQAGHRGEFLGRVSLQFRKGSGKVTDARLIPTEDLPYDEPLFRQHVKPIVDWAQDLMSRQIGRIDPQLQISAQEVKQQFDVGELGLANFICDALYERLRKLGYDLDFTMLDLSAIQCGFPEKDRISFGDCFKMMPYPDLIRFYQLSGAQLIKLLEDNARRLRDKDQDQLERGFLHFSKQIRYLIGKESANQDPISLQMTFQGQPLQEMANRDFVVGTTCFTRVLSAKWEDSILPDPLRLESFPYQDTDIVLRHEIVAYLREMDQNPASGSGYLDGRLRIAE